MKLRTIIIIGTAVAVAAAAWAVTRPSAPPEAIAAAPAEAAGTITPPTGGLTGVIPTDVTWVLSNEIAVPISPTAGPSKTSAEGIRSGFSHDPSGALMAAGNYAAADAQRFTSTTVDPSALIEERMMPWPGQAQDRAAAVQLRAQMDPTRMTMQVCGFRFLNYDGDHATVLVAEHITKPTNIPMAGYNAWINLVWSAGDWWIAPALDGQGEIGTPMTWPMAAQYTPWAGV